MDCLLIYGTFASIMTGNMLLVTSKCIEGDGDKCALHVSVLASYSFGFVLYRCLTTLVYARGALKRTSAHVVSSACVCVPRAADATGTTSRSVKRPENAVDNL